MFIYFLFLELIHEVIATIVILDKGIFPLEQNSVALQFYLDIENRNRALPCKLYTRAKKCCLTNPESSCDSIHVYNKNLDIIKPKDRKTVVFIYPSVFQHDKQGFCDFFVAYRCGHKLVKKQSFNITFDTRVAKLGKKSNKLRTYVGDRKVRHCDSLDEDSLNNCSPVDCNVKYADEKPFYDHSKNKCVEAATCVGDFEEELAEEAYLPQVNFCRDLSHPLEIQDIYDISKGIGVVKQKVETKPEFVAEVETNCTTISQYLSLLRDMMFGKLCPRQDGVIVDYSESSTLAILSILGYIIALSALVVSFTLCVHTLTWLHAKWETGSLENKYQNLKKKFSRNGGRPVVIQRQVSPRESKIDSNIKRGLLRDVIVRDIPLELRNSVVDVCERIGKDVRWKKRYRVADLASVAFDKDNPSSVDTSATSSLHENSDEEKLVK